MAASSKRSIMGERGSRFLTISQPVRSVPSRCRFPIRRSFMSAAVKGCIDPIYRSVTAFTNRLTREKPGRIWDCAMDNRWRSSRSILEIRIDSSLRWPVIHTVPMKSAEFSARSMAVKHSRRFSTATKTPGVVTSRSIRPIRTSSMRPFGNHEKGPGKIAPGMALMAASSNQRTAAKPGINYARAFPRKLSRRTSRSRRVRRRHCSLPLRP